tara:strand:- start:2675 stop:2926 length:252 start_codon:yes stop_codon:yes gene_type:complete
MKKYLLQALIDFTRYVKQFKAKRNFHTSNKTEREGFEPSTEVASCNSLAGSRFQPLSHLSRGVHTLSSALSQSKEIFVEFPFI